MDKEFLASKEFLDYMRKESRKVGAANLKRVENTGKRFYLGELNISNGIMAMGYIIWIPQKFNLCLKHMSHVIGVRDGKMQK